MDQIDFATQKALNDPLGIGSISFGILALTGEFGPLFSPGFDNAFSNPLASASKLRWELLWMTPTLVSVFVLFS